MTRRPFRLEEATIDELHQAIRSGEATCFSIVQHYLARVRAYKIIAGKALIDARSVLLLDRCKADVPRAKIGHEVSAIFIQPCPPLPLCRRACCRSRGPPVCAHA